MIDEKKLEEAALEKIFSLAAPIEYEYAREIDVRQKAIDACVKIAGIANDALAALANAPKPEMGEDLISKILEQKNKILEDFTRAYVAETGLMPSQMQLIEQRFQDKVVWRFEPRARYVSPEVRELLGHYRFLLNAAENLYQPDKPLHKGLCPSFYHTLTFEGDAELIEKTKAARKALRAVEGK